MWNYRDQMLNVIYCDRNVDITQESSIQMRTHAPYAMRWHIFLANRERISICRRSDSKLKTIPMFTILLIFSSILSKNSHIIDSKSGILLQCHFPIRRKYYFRNRIIFLLNVSPSERITRFYCYEIRRKLYNF